MDRTRWLIAMFVLTAAVCCSPRSGLDALPTATARPGVTIQPTSVCPPTTSPPTRVPASSPLTATPTTPPYTPTWSNDDPGWQCPTLTNYECQVEVSRRQEYQLIGQCQRTECLYARQLEPNVLTGVANITGYYTQVEDSAWEETRVCDSFVVITGSVPFIKSMVARVEAGNSIYKIDELGRLIVHLDINELSEAELQMLMSSNAQSLAELIVFIPMARGRSVDACYSPLQIIGVR